MASNPEILKEAKQLKAAGKKLKPHHQAALDKAQRAVDAKRAKRQTASAEKPTASKIADAALSKGPAALVRQTPSYDTSKTNEVPVTTESISGDLRHHDAIRELADHISDRLSEVETPANSIGVGRIAQHLNNTYKMLDAHQYKHKTGDVPAATLGLSKASEYLGHAEKEFKNTFSGEKLVSSPVPMAEVATDIAKQYATSDTPGVGSEPDTGVKVAIPKERRITKEEKSAREAALEAAKPASVKRFAELTPDMMAANKEAFKRSNPSPVATPANDRMLREANRAKLSAIADIKRRYPEAPNGAPQATFDYHVNKATEALHAGQPLAQDTKSFLGNDVIFHVKRAVQQAKLSGGIKATNIDSDMGEDTAKPIENEVKIPSSEDAPGEATLRPGRGARGGSMDEFTNGRG
jgi:hypothetical protein